MCAYGLVFADAVCIVLCVVDGVVFVGAVCMALCLCVLCACCVYVVLCILCVWLNHYLLLSNYNLNLMLIFFIILLSFFFIIMWCSSIVIIIIINHSSSSQRLRWALSDDPTSNEQNNGEPCQTIDTQHGELGYLCWCHCSNCNLLCARQGERNTKRYTKSP